MKKALLLTLALLVTPSLVAAQSASGTVNASATVLAVLSVTNVGDLDFGSITPGTGATVDLLGTGTPGALQIDHNSEFSVSVTPPANLTYGVETLPVSFICVYSDAAIGGTLVGAPTACNALANAADPGGGVTQTTYLQVGGGINSADTSNRVPGTYTGSLVFTVTSIY